MCRLFGFRGEAGTRFDDALVYAPNALARQSREHPDGWGLARFEDAAPTLERGLGAAHADPAFAEAVSRLTGPTVVAHVRKASVGPKALSNTHPFTHGRWVFAHNGTVPSFAQVRGELEADCAPAHRGRIAGDTDSEVLFALFLTALGRRREPSLDDVCTAIDATVRRVNEPCDARGLLPSLNLLVTDGRTMAACRQGRSLFFSTHRPHCAKKAGCASHREACESPVPLLAKVTHFVVASEPFGPGHVWREVPEGELVAVDAELRLVRRELSGALLEPHALPPVTIPA